MDHKFAARFAWRSPAEIGSLWGILDFSPLRRHLVPFCPIPTV